MGGAQELGIVYINIIRGAKEPRNLQNHRGEEKQQAEDEGESEPRVTSRQQPHRGWASRSSVAFPRGSKYPIIKYLGFG